LGFVLPPKLHEELMYAWASVRPDSSQSSSWVCRFCSFARSAINYDPGHISFHLPRAKRFSLF
jgi:hypothetical protein